MEIINRSFTISEFKSYVASLSFANWKPSFVVRHSTGLPTLAMRPDGLSHQHLINIADGYERNNGWHVGPHLFVDDFHINVFSSLQKPGINSPSWNSESFGVEQLGNYNFENYDSGRGLKVQLNAIAAIAILSHAVGIDSHSMKDHLEDPKTTHKDCPGSLCHSGKNKFMDDVHNYMLTL